MITLVTLQQAKSHLQVDHDHDDTQIQEKIDQASAIVMDYLKVKNIPEDWQGATAFGSPQAGVPGEIQAACLLVIGELYDKKEAAINDTLSVSVCSLLHRHRTPAMA